MCVTCRRWVRSADSDRPIRGSWRGLWWSWCHQAGARLPMSQQRLSRSESPPPTAWRLGLETLSDEQTDRQTDGSLVIILVLPVKVCCYGDGGCSHDTRCLFLSFSNLKLSDSVSWQLYHLPIRLIYCKWINSGVFFALSEAFKVECPLCLC